VNATVADVFAPARLGPVELRNRVIKAATFEGMTPHALVTDDLIAFHLRPARGGVGMTTVAYCAVSPEGRTDRHQIWMRPEAVPGLRRLTDAVHAEGAGHNYLVSSFLSPRLNKRTDDFGGSRGVGKNSVTRGHLEPRDAHEADARASQGVVGFAGRGTASLLRTPTICLRRLHILP
jgi:2,4-dienoyl-CoA reductase-like NADH-dependent reductase (Old Yellow Enzyme family)